MSLLKTARRGTMVAGLLAATCWPPLSASAQMPPPQPLHLGPAKAGGKPAVASQTTTTQTTSTSGQTTATTSTTALHRHHRHVHPTAAMSAVRAAYQQAVTEPTRQNFVNGALMYDYEPNKLYTLHTSPRFLTAIALRPGEKLVSKAAGDTVRWVMDETEGATNAAGQSQTIVIIKPIEGGLRTNVVLTTDQRVYLLEAVSHAAPYYNSMISWNYPVEQAREAQLTKAISTVKAMAQSAEVVSPSLSVSRLNFDYSIISKGGRGGLFHAAGAAPRWTPVRVFDDGAKTYIQFPHDLATSEAPPLFLIGPHDQAELVNYRQAGGYYVVDRLISVAELRLGDKPQSIVRIAFAGKRGGIS